jgi:RNA polymerase sigma-70 factor (ECF subfamily)
VDAFDAAADVFAVAWRRLDVVPDGDDTLRWLYGVAYRVISSQWRRGRARRKVLDALRGRQPEPASGPETEVVRRAEYSQVLAAAARLSGEDREILRLAMWEELSHGEIAAALGLRVDAVRQRFHRAKKRLAHEYRRLGGTVPPSHDHEERI